MIHRQFLVPLSSSVTYIEIIGAKSQKKASIITILDWANTWCQEVKKWEDAKLMSICSGKKSHMMIDFVSCLVCRFPFSWYFINYLFLQYTFDIVGIIDCYRFCRFIKSDIFFTNLHLFVEAICFSALIFWPKIYMNSKVISCKLLFLTDYFLLEFWWFHLLANIIFCPVFKNSDQNSDCSGILVGIVCKIYNLSV